MATMFLLLLCLTAATGTASSEATSADAQTLRLAQVEWLRGREGGFFTESLGFQPPSGDASAGGIFAVQDIQKGEVLMKVPRSSQFGPSRGDEWSRCATARRLARHYYEGKQQGDGDDKSEEEEKSDFWPYVQYVFEAFPHEQLASAWSPAGKDLIHNIVGTELSPQHFGVGSYAEHCTEYGYHEEDVADEEAELLDAAYRIVWARCWYELCIPVYDMVNHANGHLHNMDQRHDSRTHPDMEIIALRDVKAGEQMFLSYNECNDYTCEGIKYTYITPQIFSIFGFVEYYSGSQRWNFVTSKPYVPRDQAEGILFQIDLADDQCGDESGSKSKTDNNPDDLDSLKITWISDEPNDEQKEWLQAQLGRLEGLEEYVKYTAGRLDSEYEGQASIQYHKALMTAMKLALLWADGPVKPTCGVAGAPKEA